MLLFTDRAESADSLAPRIKAVGLGGCGIHVINHLIERGFRHNTLAIDIDGLTLSTCKAERKLLISTSPKTNSPEFACACAEAEQGRIESELAEGDAQLIVLIAGLGGGTGSGIISTVARIAQENSQLLIPIVTLPAYFETAERLLIAKDTFSQIRKQLSFLLHIDGNELKRFKVGLRDFFSMSDKIVCEIIESILHPLTEPGLINLDVSVFVQLFEELEDPWISIGMGTGSDALEKAFNDALSRPLNKIELEKPSTGYFHFTVPKETEFYYDQLYDMRKRFVCDDLVFGCTYNATFSDHVNLTIIAQDSVCNVPEETDCDRILNLFYEKPD